MICYYANEIAKVADAQRLHEQSNGETDNISSSLLLTDETGHRWEIRIPADDSVEHRRVGRTGWLADWLACLTTILKRR